jgi:hypothetical protein
LETYFLKGVLRMIEVEVSDNTRDLLDAFGITSEQVEEAINNRDRAVLDPGVNRLIAVRWNSEHEAVLVDSTITSKRVEGNEIVIERVRAMLALKLEPSLPAGRIDKDSELEPLMLAVAESFGQPISFHRSATPVVLYSGPWEENQVRISEAQAEQEVLVLATVSPSTRSVFGGWAFNLNKYIAWLRRNQVQDEQVESIRITQHESWRPPEDAGAIDFSDEFKAESLRNFGIKARQTLEAVNTPDRTDEMEFYGFIIRLHFKVLQTQPSSGLLVIESVKEERRTVDFAFRVYPQLAHGVQDFRPLEILRALTNNFGLLITDSCVSNATYRILAI